jgi:iron(III) transport system permease protein
VSYQSDINPRHSTWRKVRHTLSIVSHEPANLLGALLLMLFSWIILAPVMSVLLNAVLVQSGDEGRTGATEGTFTAWYLLRTLTSRMSELLLWTPLLNTLAVALSTVAMALIVGVALAWLINRTDIAGRKWFATLLIVPFMLPSWTFALAWSTIFKNHAIGGQPGWLEAMGIQTPNWMAYGYFPIVTIMVLHYAPLVILIVGNALKRMDSQMEECARVLGASRGIIAFKIIIPLVRPALLSSALLIFADCIGEFALPYILGLPVHFDTLSTGLYRAISTRQSGVAAVIATVIMLMGMLTLMLDMKMLREAKRFVTLGGKGVMERRRTLGRWRTAAAALPLLFVLLGVAIPLLTLFLSTVMILPGRFTAENFTFDYWIGHNLDTVALHNGILLTPEFWHTVWNTLVIVGSASIACGVLGLLVGYAVMRCHFRWVAAFLRQLTFLPYLVPGIAFATAFLSLFAVARGPVPALYGTPLILILALIAEKMPYASRFGDCGDDPARKRSRRSGADRRSWLVCTHPPHRYPDSGGAAGHRDPAAVYLRN